MAKHEPILAQIQAHSINLATSRGTMEWSAERKMLLDTLQFYADPANYKFRDEIHDDFEQVGENRWSAGKRARAAISKATAA